MPFSTFDSLPASDREERLSVSGGRFQEDWCHVVHGEDLRTGGREGESGKGTFLNGPKLSRNVLLQKAFAQHRARPGHSEILLRAPFLTRVQQCPFFSSSGESSDTGLLTTERARTRLTTP